MGWVVSMFTSLEAFQAKIEIKTVLASDEFMLGQF
jgi:hypothetical protein